METNKAADSKLHVLVLPYPAQGHINPILQFTKRLISTGKIKATHATTIFLSKSMHTTDPTSPITVETISDGHDDGGYSQAESSESYISIFRTVGFQTLTQLLKKLNESGQRVDCLIYDAFLPWALDVAKQFGVVGAVFFTQSCAVNSIYYHVYKGLLELPLKQPSVEIQQLPVLEARELPSFVYDYGSYPGFHGMVVNQFCNIEEVDWVFFNNFYELEKEVGA